jgi:Aldo/keto reductase family
LSPGSVVATRLDGAVPGLLPGRPVAGAYHEHDRSAPPPDGGRFTLGYTGPMYQKRYWHERMFDAVDALRKLADQAGVNIVTLSVAWVLANRTITAPIIGASNPGQLDASLAAATYALDPDLKAHLDDLTYEYRLGDAAAKPFHPVQPAHLACPPVPRQPADRFLLLSMVRAAPQPSPASPGPHPRVYQTRKQGYVLPKFPVK